MQVLEQKRRHCIPVKILDQSNKMHFRINFSQVFFIYLFFNRIFHLFLRHLNILSTSFRAKMATLHYGLNSWPVGTRGIFVQNLQEFFFSFKWIFHFLLGPLNMLSTGFVVKKTTLYSSQYTWPVGQMDIFVQILTEFIYLFIFQ